MRADAPPPLNLARRLADFDEELFREAGGLVAGVDEAGRGPLAGPVVAAAVVLPPGAILEGVDDSKKLTAAERRCALAGIQGQALAIGIGVVGPAEIDTINILQATLRAANKALAALECDVRMIMTDYLHVDGGGRPVRAEAKADARSQSVAAASIVAKTTRDRLMEAYAGEYPGFGFERNKGYGSPEHLSGLADRGPTTLHRMTFAGVSMFSEEPALSVSLLRLRGMVEEGRARDFEDAAEALLRRLEPPLADREAGMLRIWLRRSP